MAKRRTRRGKQKYNWAAIIAAAVLASAAFIIYLATGNSPQELLPDWGNLTSALTQAMGGTSSGPSQPELADGETAEIHFIDV